MFEFVVKTLLRGLFQPIPIQSIAVTVSRHARNLVVGDLQVRHALLETLATHGVGPLLPLIEALVGFLARPYAHRELPLLRAGK